MPPRDSRDYQGVVVPGAGPILDLLNQARYGLSESDRVELVNRQLVPGVTRWNSTPHPADPNNPAANVPHSAGGERYTSSFLFGNRYPSEVLAAGLPIATDVVDALLGRSDPMVAGAQRAGLQAGIDAAEGPLPTPPTPSLFSGPSGQAPAPPTFQPTGNDTAPVVRMPRNPPMGSGGPVAPSRPTGSVQDGGGPSTAADALLGGADERNDMDVLSNGQWDFSTLLSPTPKKKPKPMHLPGGSGATAPTQFDQTNAAENADQTTFLQGGGPGSGSNQDATQRSTRGVLNDEYGQAFGTHLYGMGSSGHLGGGGGGGNDYIPFY